MSSESGEVDLDSVVGGRPDGPSPRSHEGHSYNTGAGFGTETSHARPALRGHTFCVDEEVTRITLYSD